MTTELVVRLAYLAASLCFLLALRELASPETARRGVVWAEIGMALAVAGTLVRREIVSYAFLLAGAFAGGALGALISLRIPMTRMPERIAFSHAFGGLAVALVGVAEQSHRARDGPPMNAVEVAAVGVEVVLGALTFTGSMVAFGKLGGLVSSRPLAVRGQNVVNALLAVLAIGLVAWLVARPTAAAALLGAAAVALVLGVSLVLPIGGADMPVVICVLNAYAGLAAAATGFALRNDVLVVCGALDGASGLLLGRAMSRAMNRSFANVLFGRLGAVDDRPAAEAPPPTVATVEDAAEVLRAARSLVVIPGYGMAVSQAQHALRDLAGALAAEGCSVRYAIHPVAGRMPGHMNVLLAEANVPYDLLFDLDAINDDFAATDVALVVGANDVVNPAARTDPASPIYGMPILAADAARTCIVLKRSLAPGFAGIDNALFTRPGTLLVLGDAKKTLGALTAAIKGG
jgi:NAD(P) transhydrogenase subunit beta